MFEQIERTKQQYTDKYVVVDATRPELARFRDVVGRVKTVNMSGRALVEFDDYHLNIGRYDIAPEFLKVVDKPPQILLVDLLQRDRRNLVSFVDDRSVHRLVTGHVHPRLGF